MAPSGHLRKKKQNKCCLSEMVRYENRDGFWASKIAIHF